MPLNHTPGPWRVESVMSEAMHDICLGYPVPRAGNPIVIASVNDDEYVPITAQEAEANATLMAAAPEMYRVIRDAHSALRQGGPLDIVHAKALLSACLKEIEGGAP